MTLVIKKVSLYSVAILFLFGLGYFSNVPQKTNNNSSIAITARMIFTQQCSESFDSVFGKSSNEMRMSKEQMQANLLCYQWGDKLSNHILNTKEEINEENVVKIIDSAIGEMKKEILTQQEREPSSLIEEPKTISVNPSDFI